MGTFTAVSDRDIAEIADAFELGSVREYEPIAAGTINSNFRVATWTPLGDLEFFVRINEGKSEDDVAWEARLVEALFEGGVPTPPPRKARDGRRYAAFGTKWVSAFAWREGSHLAPAEVTPDHAHRLGAALGTLHRIGLELPADWRRVSIYDHAHLVGRFRSFEKSTDPALAHAIEIVSDELATAEKAAPIRAAATRGIIHGDLFRDNVLWTVGRRVEPRLGLHAEQVDRPQVDVALEPQIAAILDFEQASGGSLAYDLAVCLNDWCWEPIPMPVGGSVRFDLVAALLTGYQEQRPLSDPDRRALLIEVRAAATRFTITRITDVYLAKVTNPEKDFRAFLARVECWRGQALHQLSSLL